MIKELTCINCPMGCNLKVEIENGIAVKVTGNTCAIGERYGKEEVTAPKRVLTTSVAITGAKELVAPVKTSKAIDKQLLMAAMKEINQVKVQAPVKIGQVVIENILNTGADVVITRNIKESANSL